MQKWDSRDPKLSCPYSEFMDPKGRRDVVRQASNLQSFLCHGTLRSTFITSYSIRKEDILYSFRYDTFPGNVSTSQPCACLHVRSGLCFRPMSTKPFHLQRHKRCPANCARRKNKTRTASHRIHERIPRVPVFVHWPGFPNN